MLKVGFPLDAIGQEIGKFKLEYIFKEVVMLGPVTKIKYILFLGIYGGITTDNKYICKVKGYKTPNLISFVDLKSLLVKDTMPLELNHSKWYRDMINGEFNSCNSHQTVTKIKYIL